MLAVLVIAPSCHSLFTAAVLPNVEQMMPSLHFGHAEVITTSTRQIRVRLGGDGSPMAPHAKGPPPMDSEEDDVIVSDDFDGDSDDVVASDDLDISDQPGESNAEDQERGGATKPSKPRKQPVLSHDEQESLLAAQAGVTTSDASILELEVIDGCADVLPCCLTILPCQQSRCVQWLLAAQYKVGWLHACPSCPCFVLMRLLGAWMNATPA